MAKRLRDVLVGSTLVDENKLSTTLSTKFDDLRQTLWDNVEPLTVARGALAISKNQGDAVPVMREMMIENYGLKADPVLKFKQAAMKASDPYPVALFDYLASKAPQIGGLT